MCSRGAVGGLAAGFGASYQFLDVSVTVSSHTPAAIACFDRIYGLFRCASPPDRPGLQVRIDTDAEGRGEVICGEARRPIPMADETGEYAGWLVWDAVAKASRRYLFLHAAAAVVGGSAVLMAGRSGHGKSTLASGLTELGAELLTDDVTPIDRTSGRAAWFPKSGVPPTPPLPEDAPVEAVAFLSPQARPDRLRVALDRAPTDESAFCSWAEESGVSVEPFDGHFEVSAGGLGDLSLRAFEALCEAAGVTVLRDLSEPPARFGDAPAIRPLPAADAGPLLVANAFGREREGAVGLLWEFLSALEGATFWDVRVGAPEPTASALLRAAKGGA